MSFKRLDPEDFILSADSITAALWTTNNPTLNTFFTSSTQEASTTGDYYLSVYQTSSAISGSEVQFDTTYGNKFGSGSALYNSIASVSNSPTKTIYGQYRALVLGDENSDFIFGNVTQSQFHIISVERSNYKQSLFPGSLNLTLTKSGATLKLTDNSNDISVVPYINGTRVYQIVSGSNGSAYSGDGYSAAQGSYGWFIPDMGTILLNSAALAVAGGAGGGIGLTVTATNSSNTANYTALFDAIKTGASFTLNSQENITSDYVYVRPQNAEFNYTTNPSFISGSTGEVLYSSFINNPQTYITTVGLYNDANELLAVAKLSRPLVKDFTKEALIRVKLDF
jgi:hypothetical protein